MIGPRGKFYNSTGADVQHTRARQARRSANAGVGKANGPNVDSDSDIPSLASSDEEDSDTEIERKKSLAKPSAASREKSPEYRTGGLPDNETISSEAEASDKEDKSSILASEDVLEEDEEDEDDDEDSDFISERGQGGFPGFKEQKKKIAKT